MLTHVFPRWENDVFGRFLYILARGVMRFGTVSVDVVAPHESNLLIKDELGDVRIRRFRYATPKLEKLAYRGEMAELVKKNFLNKLIFFSFLTSCLIQAILSHIKNRYDLIHANWIFPSGFIALIISFFLNKPFLLTCHGTDVRILKTGNSALKLVGKMILRKARRVTTVSTFLKEELCLIQPDISGKVSVIPMPVDTEKIFPTSVEKKDEKIILCVARLSQQKRLDTLIRAAYEMKNMGLLFKVCIAGEGGERKTLEKLIHTLQLSSHVELLGAINPSEINKLYNLCDVFVLPSENEGFGLVLVEAMLCAKPVVGANSGGIRDIIKDGKNGFLFNVGDCKNLASKIEELLKNKSMAESMGKKGNLMASNYLEKEICCRYEIVYREAR